MPGLTEDARKGETEGIQSTFSLQPVSKGISYSYDQHCTAHLAITDAPIIRTAAKSQAKINSRRLTAINFRCYGLSRFRGGSRMFFRRGCTRLLLYFNTNKPHSFFSQNTSCIRKPQVISGEEGSAHPLHPPPRSAPAIKNTNSRSLQCPAIKEVDCSSLSFTLEIVKVARTTLHLFGGGGGGGWRGALNFERTAKSRKLKP